MEDSNEVTMSGEESRQAWVSWNADNGNIDKDMDKAIWQCAKSQRC